MGLSHPIDTDQKQMIVLKDLKKILQALNDINPHSWSSRYIKLTVAQNIDNVKAETYGSWEHRLLKLAITLLANNSTLLIKHR